MKRPETVEGRGKKEMGERDLSSKQVDLDSQEKSSKEWRGGGRTWSLLCPASGQELDSEAKERDSKEESPGSKKDFRREPTHL